MDDNIRLNAHNRCLKETNNGLMETFAKKDIDFQVQKSLNSNARREVNFKKLMFETIKDTICDLDPREKFQESNLRGLIKYGKKLTIELKEQEQKVGMSERII